MKDKVPDRRMMEKMSSDLSRLLQEQNFESEEEMKEFLNGIVKREKVPGVPPKDAVSYAQDIIYEAWETESREKRIKLANEALAVSPDCADAYNLLAEEAETVEEAKELYQKGVDAGRRALGEEAFKLDKGHFWGYVPSRPYMRARAGLMECLWKLGEHDEAIAHAKEMLRLNENDNQGIRYILIAYLAELGRYDELDEFLNKGHYEGDCGTEWLYTQVLLSFAKRGDSSRARDELKIAVKRNPHVPEYILGRKSIPRVLPDRVILGGEDEAFCYADRFLTAWKRVPGAVEWLRKQVSTKVHPKVGRNELCPCGSGKKYKKCCL